MIQSFDVRLRKTLERLEIVYFIEINSLVYFFKINLATNQSNSNMTNVSLHEQEHAYRPAVSVEDFLLEETESTMFLIMYLDQRLSRCNNVENICAMVASDIFAIQTLAKYCSIEVLRTSYFGLVHPHFAKSGKSVRKED